MIIMKIMITVVFSSLFVSTLIFSNTLSYSAAEVDTYQYTTYEDATREWGTCDKEATVIVTSDNGRNTIGCDSTFINEVYSYYKHGGNSHYHAIVQTGNGTVDTGPLRTDNAESRADLTFHGGKQYFSHNREG